jgi:hypothetical protein
MAVNTETTALITTFTDRRKAERFVAELKRAGFREDEIGMITPDRETQEEHVEEGATAGVLTGGALGAFAGAVATGLIPGVGPVVAAGLLAGILTGAAAGAAAGGVLGALIGLGISEEEARQYEREFQAGRTLVVVQALGRNAEALALLHRLEPEL